MRVSSASLLVAACLAAGCATYDSGYLFHPTSGTGATVRGVAGAVGLVEATILGVRAGTSDGRPSIDVELRVERWGATPVAVRGHDGMRLVTGNRESLDARDVRAVGPAVAASGGAATLRASFPLPGPDPSVCDLSGLDLVVPVDIDGRTETVTIGFARGRTSYVWADPWGWPGHDPNGLRTGWRQ